ncbi:hypothetical protein C1637_09475 [Chryseobacterium lactis]|uniref:Uncharacterized protein n=1 Tax=Chryseobacterium lactis TaxID=1241981 RepID=A0A3G6RM83_CHRLC|nr:hypothetical protein EG342_10230 [Chryseobacterium lactis]AZB02640.1 hypothetical protein EG341_01090 [Chryseobacterium lactis]PNW14067.1 hypothetical protein C1637_09475 [Chryseobacterium lactis]
MYHSFLNLFHNGSLKLCNNHKTLFLNKEEESFLFSGALSCYPLILLAPTHASSKALKLSDASCGVPVAIRAMGMVSNE